MKFPTVYAVVRRDLPLELILPQLGHALHKAAYFHAVQRRATPDTFDLKDAEPILIVKGARNEAKLLKLHEKLVFKQVDHVTWTEPDDGPLKNQMTSLALLPGDKDLLAPLLNDFQHFRWADVAAFTNPVKP